MLDTRNGSTIALRTLGGVDNDAFVLYDEVGDRPIIASFFDGIIVIAKGSQSLEIEWSGFPPHDLGIVRSEITPDGRFLVGYCGYVFGNDFSDPTINANNFISLDLDTKEFHVLTLKGKIAPSANVLDFHPLTRAIYVPYSTKIKLKKNGIKGCACGTRLVDILTLAADGTLSRGLQFEIPLGSSDRNLISAFNNVALSPSGALGFISTSNRKIFSFDTLTGQIVNEQTVSDNLTYIYLHEPTGLLIQATGTNKLVLLNVGLGPIINEVKIGKKRTVIKGANFLSGVRVQINGQEIEGASRNQNNPGREIIIDLGKKDFTPGQTFTVLVTNRDGMSSESFPFGR